METTNLAISVRRARSSDAPSLAALINSAYTVEHFFTDGERTSPSEIDALIRKGAPYGSGSGGFLILEKGPVLAAAVYVDTSANGGYIGMLSVDPNLQGLGLGTRLVRIAEAMCEAMGATSVRLRIVNLREELARWYKSLGYREVGTAPYDHRPTKQPCHFVELHKWLASSDAAAVA